MTIQVILFMIAISLTMIALTVAILDRKSSIRRENNRLTQYIDQLKADINRRVEEYYRLDRNTVNIDIYRARESELLSKTQETNLQNIVLSDKLVEVQADYDKIFSNQISKSVRLGQVAEAVAPLLAQFPYDYKQAVPMFRPIDYVVFADTEVVFVEYKTGGAVLSDKQKNIRDNIRAGRVRFEVHRMDENGYTVKE